MKGKLKWLAVPLLLLWAPLARGQCSPNPCYTANPPKVTRLTPAQYAAQGDGHTNTATTINVSYTTSSGVVYSHSATMGSGTVVQVNYQSWNASRVDLYYASNGGSRVLWQSNVALNGSFPWNFTGQQTLQLFAVATSSSGIIMQDIDTLTITTQAPGVYGGDGLPSNTIVHFHASGGGGSMLNDFTECQAGQIHQCINATHTPFTTLTVNNTTSGETQFHSKHVSGNTASANQSVGFSDDIFMSALPEDRFEYTEGDEVDCSVFGPIGVGPVHMDIRFERAITEEYISSILNSNGMHPEHIYCIIAATPPDFPGADEALPGTPSGQVVNIAFLYREWPAGTTEAGTPWNLVFPDIQEVGIGYYVKTTMEPDPSGCTMWDNGFRHLPLPTPLDPQPQ